MQEFLIWYKNIIHDSVLGHETMVYNVCLFIFLFIEILCEILFVAEKISLDSDIINSLWHFNTYKG